MDKKKFIPLEIEITWFDTEDVITTSTISTSEPYEESSNPTDNEFNENL